MGRPKASQSIRDFAITFANVVTISSSSPCDWVAKNGCYSIYQLLAVLAPRACRAFNRNGISEPELNKALEGQGGFRRVRVRIRAIVASAGTLLFDCRRWLDPNSPADFHLLSRAYSSLRRHYGHLIESDLPAFAAEVSAIREGWLSQACGSYAQNLDR